MSKKIEVTIKKVSSDEPNVSKRHVTYDVYHNGKYHKTFNDVNDALDHKEKMQKEEVELDEKVLDIQQRQKRAQIMRRYKSKIERAREIAKKKMAPEANIRKRAFVQARQIIRRRVAGSRGAEYEKLGPSEKMAIDRAVEGKQKAIKKLALRLIPRVKQAEAKRLHTFMKGQQIHNQGQPEGKSKESSGSSSVKESLNNLFSEAFAQPDPSADAPVATSQKKMPKKDKSKNSDIIQYNKFQEEVEFDTPAFAALFKKSEKSGIDLETLGEVYNRGWNAWAEGLKVTQEQYAFARVNSFINQGKTYFNEDSDLHEMKTVTNRSHAKMLEIKVGGKAHSYKKYGWGLHHPTYGPLKDEKFNSKAEMKAAMEKHPHYNPKLSEEAELEENAWNQLGQKKPVGNTLPAPAKGSVPKHGRKFSEGDHVVPHTGPYAGQVHRVTSSRAGSVNIVRPNTPKYDSVTVRAKHEHLSPATPEQTAKYKAERAADHKRMFGEGRAPGTPSIKRYTRNDGTTALKSLNKWGKRKDWRDTEGGLAKAREHAGVDKVTEEVQQTNENFIDGKGPGKPGDSARHGLKGKSASELRKIRSSETASPRKKQLAHWMLNMHHNEETEIQELSATTINAYRRGMEKDVALNPKMDPKKKERRLKGFKTSTNKILGLAKVNVEEGLKDPEDNPCWKGYKPVGTKKKAGKTVPNCVPVNEEERIDPKTKVEGTNCRNCVYWRKDLEKPVTKEELNPNGGLKAPNKEYIAMSKRIDLGTLPGKDSGVKVKGFCDHDMIKDWVTERMCCSQWDSDGMIRDYKGQSPVMEADGESIKPQTTSPGSKHRKKIENVDRDTPHTEHGKQQQIQKKIIDEEGNSQPDPKKRLVGTDSLVKAYKKDTPGQSLDESFNIAFASGVGVTLTAADLGMRAQGAFALHPSVIEEMERRAAEEMEEEVRSADIKGVIVRTASGKTVVRKQKVDRKIIGSGNLTDGKPDDTL